MRRGEIWSVDLDPTRGHEQRGRRPVLIVSADAFNAVTRLPVVVPITSGADFARARGFAVELAGTKTTGAVRCDQPRTLDFRSRNARLVESAPSDVVDEVLARLAPIFDSV